MLLRLACLIWLVSLPVLAQTCPAASAVAGATALVGTTCTPVPAQRSWIYPTTGSAVSGFSVTIPDGITAVAVVASSVLLTGTITLPFNPVDGQPITINCPKGITAVTLTPSAGQAVSNNFLPTVCGINQPIRVKWYGVNSTWYPN